MYQKEDSLTRSLKRRNRDENINFKPTYRR